MGLNGCFSGSRDSQRAADVFRILGLNRCYAAEAVRRFLANFL